LILPSLVVVSSSNILGVKLIVSVIDLTPLPLPLIASTIIESSYPPSAEKALYPVLCPSGSFEAPFPSFLGTMFLPGKLTTTSLDLDDTGLFPPDVPPAEALVRLPGGLLLANPPPGGPDCVGLPVILMWLFEETAVVAAVFSLLSLNESSGPPCPLRMDSAAWEAVPVDGGVCGGG
jgi:hypothetical protein